MTSVDSYNPYLPVTVSSSQQEDDTTSRQTENSVGYINGSIVGVQYYSGDVNDGEVVVLCREPDNVYDRNAIRVDNSVRSKIGHLPRDLAAVLAPMIDSGSISVGGYIEKRGSNPRMIPIQISVYAASALHDEVKRKLPIGQIVAPWRLNGPPPPFSSSSSRFAGGHGSYSQAVSRTGSDPYGSSIGHFGASRFGSANTFQGRGGSVRPFDKTKEDLKAEAQRQKTQQMQEEQRRKFVAEQAKAEAELKRLELERRKQECSLSSMFKASFLGVALDGAEMPRMTPPDVIRTSLFPHQQQGLAWLVERERDAFTVLSESKRSHFFWEYQPSGGRAFYYNTLTRTRVSTHPVFPGGGLLCDDMGLGKTLSLLSLTMTERKGRTLIVCPTSIIQEWVSQAEEHLASGAAKIYAYYGKQRSDEALQAAEIVVTSYNILRDEFSALENAAAGSAGTAAAKKPKVDSKSGQQGLFAPGLFYRLICDEAQMIKNHTSKTSFAVHKLDARQRWVVTGTPISNRLDELYALFRAIRAFPFDVISVWRDVIQAPLRSSQIEDVEEGYRRLQTIVKGMCLRRAKQRPAEVHLTQSDTSSAGTVLLPDLVVEQRFVDLTRAEKALYDRVESGSRKLLERNSGQHSSSSASSSGCKRDLPSTDEEGLEIKKVTSMLSLLCRIRQACCHPALLHRASAISNPNSEDDILTSDFQQQLAQVVENYAEVAEGEMRDCVIPEERDRQRLKSMLQNEERRDEANGTVTLGECPICYCDMEKASACITPCAHAFCAECILHTLAIQDSCPICRSHLERTDVRSLADVEKAIFVDPLAVETVAVPDWLAKSDRPFVSSAKINALIEDIQQKMQSNEKIIVFSQWTSFIDLLRTALEIACIPSVSLVGSMSREARQLAVKQFQTYPASECKVFLISLRAGGFGLNLTAASHVALMDPFWNSAAELQAIDRAWRIGNVAPTVRVWRYIARGSVEERVLELQVSKSFLLSSAFGQGEERQQAQKLAQIRSQALFLVLGQQTSSIGNLV